jgi:exonuclease SbcC
MTRDNPSIIYEELLNLINEKTNLRDGKNTEIGAINSIIKADEDNQLKFASIENKLQDLNVERGYYQTLAELIGDKDGDKFNNIIQRITLRHLFKMTNDRLAIIMDRYQIDLGSEKQEDEIWVIDTYMGDERRVIDSVSGGERFVISLALALSLSDLASNNVKLDSVFIDEGFGSLSPEELDNAISMLERLQVENEKTIGIISHVESLKERISTQIVIQKLQNGESAISLKSNGKLTSLAIT